MRWWGPPWPTEDNRADVCAADAERVAIPTGHKCVWCTEPIIDIDRGVTYHPNSHAHAECHQRSVAGCAAYVRGEPCDHTGNYRDDARRVWDLLTNKT